jgi:pyridoxal phosphate enzyme (YggS family)
MKNISKNIKFIRNIISSVKSVSPVELVAVTKTFPYQDILLALKCGIKHIAENKIQEAIPKFEQLKSSLIGIKKHFIGRLQSNKIKKIVKNFDLVHSLDSMKLAYGISYYAASIGKIQDCLIEVKISQETTKIGISINDVKNFYKKSQLIQNILIRGLMVVAPYSINSEDSRPYFRQIYSLFEDIKKTFNNSSFCILSMGMSGDYKIAVEEGSNMLRIGSAIFGERDYYSNSK